MPSRWESQNVACLLWLINRCKAGANSQLPRTQLHKGCRLTCIEEILKFAFWIRGKDGDSQRRAREMPGIGSCFGERLQNGLVADRDELPSLLVLGRLRSASRVEDGL